MPNYVFDVNEGDSSAWEDEVRDCEGRVAVEHHARKLLAEAGTRQIARGSETLPATVVVCREDGTIVMSAHGWLNGTVRVLWGTTEQRDRVVRKHVEGVLLKLVAQTNETDEAIV
jgi:hypothetical protein